MIAVPRSALVVPGADERKLVKSADSGVDQVIFDLEDAVTVDRKNYAREMVTARLGSHQGPAAQSLAVRINPIGTPWFLDDVKAVVTAPGPSRSIVLPKVESAEDVRLLGRIIEGLLFGRDGEVHIDIVALIETAGGVNNAASIAPSCSRLSTLVIGYADLAASLGRSTACSPSAWLPTQDEVLRAARSAGIAALDGPHLAIRDDEQFRSAVDTVAGLGFDGKWVIHPAQIAAVNAAFVPDPDAVEFARRIVQALAEGERLGVGAVSLDGQMLDEAVAISARKTISRADAYAGFTSDLPDRRTIARNASA